MSKKLTIFFILGIIIYSALLSFAISSITTFNYAKKSVFFVTNTKSFADGSSAQEKFGCRVDYALDTNKDETVLIEYIETNKANDCDGKTTQKTITQSEFIDKVTNYKSRVVKDTLVQDPVLINNNLLRK
jgi:hypothetical protein